MLCHQNSIIFFLLFIFQVSSYIVYPSIRQRYRRSNTAEIQVDIEGGPNGGFALNLRKNEHLVTSGAVMEWHFPNGTKSIAPLSQEKQT